MPPHVSSELTVITAVTEHSLYAFTLLHLPATLGSVTISLFQEAQGSESVNALNRCTPLSDKSGPHPGLCDPGHSSSYVLWPWAERFHITYPLILMNRGKLNRQNQSFKSGRSWRVRGRVQMRTQARQYELM